MNILFVDQDNTDISKIAVGWSEVFNRNPDVKVYSAGINKGNRVDKNVKKIMKENRLALKNHHTKVIDTYDLTFDIIIYIGVEPSHKIVPEKALLQWKLDIDYTDLEKTCAILSKKVKDLFIDIKKGKFS